MDFCSKFSRGKVLDVGCGRGNLFIKNYIGTENGIGIDIFPYKGVDNVFDDLSKLPFEDEMFDTITLIAVGGHIPKHMRKPEFKEFSRLLVKNGRLLFTEGEPVTQFLVHKWSEFISLFTGKKDMDTERGMEEEEEYCMPESEIYDYMNSFSLRLVSRKRFMWGLNNLYISEKKK